MRTISLAFCGLVVLLTVSSCSKNTVNNKIVGNWELVEHIYGAIVQVSSDTEFWTLNPDHTYKMRVGSLVTSGTYRLDISRGSSPQAVLYLSDPRYTDGYTVGFNRDSLVLEGRGLYYGLGTPKMKFVKK